MAMLMLLSWGARRERSEGEGDGECRTTYVGEAMVTSAAAAEGCSLPQPPPLPALLLLFYG